MFAVYLARLLRASRPQRRALSRSPSTSLLFLPALFVFNFSAWILELDLRTLDTMAWVIVATRILLPLGFLVALLQAERFAGRALRILLERLAAAPAPEQWRDAVAEALDDPALQARLLRAGHRPLPGAGRAPADAGGGRGAARVGPGRPRRRARWPRW